MSFCPKWVFEAVCAASGAEFLSTKLDLNTVSNGYAAVLSEFYQPVNPKEIATVIDAMLRFLDELNAADTAATVLTGFCYDKITFEASNKPRKMRGMFGFADDPVKVREHGAETAVKSFKAYVFSLRNDITGLAPLDWNLTDVEDSNVFAKLANQKLSPLDFL